MKTPRIAYCSPVNPAPTGISDYSEELLPYLGQYAEVTLYRADRLKPTNPKLHRYLEILPISRLARDQRRRPYDAIVYHMGNSPAHADIWRTAQQIPGVIVLHEFVLNHFMLWYAANIYHDLQRYVREMHTRYGDEGEHIAQLMIRGRFTEGVFQFPCCESVLDVAHGIIAHSRYVQSQVAALCPALPTALVPMGIPLPTPLERARARAWLGLPADALVLVSLGHLNAYKRLEPTLQALFHLARERPTMRYMLVGSISPHFDVRGLIKRMGLEQVVHITGFLPRETLEVYVAAADICLNLRHPTGGETSASLFRLLGAGKPTLVSATGSFAELPPNVAAQVDTDRNESDLILAYCRLLADYPDLAAALGAQARHYVAQEHSLDRAAQGYVRFLAKRYRWDAVRRVRSEPLWDVSPPHIGIGRAYSAGVALPNIPPPSPDSPQHIGQVAQALVEMGVTEQDEIVLRTVAQRLTELEQ